MSRLMVDSPKALGRATSAGTSESGLRTGPPAPHARGSSATRLPRSARISTVAARTPTNVSANLKLTTFANASRRMR